jgi:hypothetical protein
LERKARFIAQVMSPGSPRDAARSIEDLDTDVVLSYAEIKAVATGNPLIREQAEVAGELARLARLAANHTKTQRDLPGRLAALRDHQQRLTAAVHRLDDLRGALVDTRGDRFHIVLADGRRYADRGDAGDAIRRLTATVAADGCWRPQFGMARFTWPDDPTVEFHLSHGDWVRLLRAHHFEIEDLIEVRPPADASSTYSFVTTEWARRWPCEEAWRARRR